MTVVPKTSSEFAFFSLVLNLIVWSHCKSIQMSHKQKKTHQNSSSFACPQSRILTSTQPYSQLEPRAPPVCCISGSCAVFAPSVALTTNVSRVLDLRGCCPCNLSPGWHATSSKAMIPDIPKTFIAQVTCCLQWWDGRLTSGHIMPKFRLVIFMFAVWDRGASAAL